MKNARFVVLLTSFIFSLLSFVIVFLDKNYSYRYLSLFFYLASVFSPFIFLIHFNLKWKHLLNKHKVFIFIILPTILVTYFFRLTNYPYVALGDEPRYNGLDSQLVFNNLEKNIFGYARYNSHGLITPTFISLFVPIFSNSVLTYRVPSALIGILTIVLVYLWSASYYNLAIGIFTSLILTFLPLHLYYSRTETIVVISTVTATVLYYFLWRLYSHKDSILNTILIGIIIGFSFNLHASIKAVSILTIIPVSVYLLYINRQKYITYFLVFFAAILIGFGPKLFQTPLDIFVNKTRVDNTSLSFKKLSNNYLTSISVIAFTNTGSHYQDHKPIISLPLFIFFIFGLIGLFLDHKKYFWLTVFYLLLIPLSNSTFTDIINADHRIIPILPMIAITSGYGIYFTAFRMFKIIKWLIVSGSIIYLLYTGFIFFASQSANILDYNDNRTVADYLGMHLIYLLKNSSVTKVTIYSSPKNIKKYSLEHYAEQRKYFLPNMKVDFIADSAISDNELEITPRLTHPYVINCNLSNLSYYCPLGYRGLLSISSR